MVKNHPINGYLIFWIVLLACFSATGLHRIITAPHPPAIEGTGPLCSTDGFLHYYFGSHNSSEKILSVIESIASKQPAVVFWPEKNNNAGIANLMLGYFAWPQKVEGIPVTQEHLEQAVEQARKKPLGSIWLSGLLPSSNLKPLIVVNRGLLAVPMELSP